MVNLISRSFGSALFLITAPTVFAADEEAGGAAKPVEERSQDDRGPPPPPPGGHHGPRLTEAQRTCMDGILGKPGTGERPSHEKMDAAMQTCGVPKPPRGPRPPRREDAPPAPRSEE